MNAFNLVFSSRLENAGGDKLNEEVKKERKRIHHFCTLPETVSQLPKNLQILLRDLSTPNAARKLKNVQEVSNANFGVAILELEYFLGYLMYI